MSELFDTLQSRYRDLVARSLAPAADEGFVESLLTFLHDARQAGAAVSDPEERSHLRTYMRFVAGLLSRTGQEIPAIELLPLDQESWPARSRISPPAGAVPAWVWGLAGAAALVVLAGLVTVAGLSVGAVPWQATATPPPSATSPPSPTPSPTLVPTPSPTPTPTPQPAPPVFSDLTIALGMLSPTEPFLVGREFDWNTRVIYAVFDYAGMQDGMAWSVVWSHEEEEVARQSHLWDTQRDGRSGTRWVTYSDPEAISVAGGNYTVRLYIKEELQAEASFFIRYYVLPTP